MAKNAPMIQNETSHPCFWMIVPAIGDARLIPPRTPKLKTAERKPRPWTNQTSPMDAGIRASMGAMAKSLNATSRSEGSEGLGSGNPEGGDHEENGGDEVHWAFSVDDGKGVAND